MDAPRLRDDQIVAYARQAGFSGEALVTMVAVALAESGGDPDVQGDTSLQNNTWGPSIGLGQIRSLWRDWGTGRSRDAKKLADPAFNLRSAFQISEGGTNFRPWSAFTNQSYRDFVDRARRAVSGAGGAAGGPQGITGGIGDMAGDFVGRLVDPFVEGLARIALTGLLIVGGVVLVTAGGWKAVAPARARAQEAGKGAIGGP